MKTVLITGGARGIGKACVEKFASNGWNVAFIYKSSDLKAQELATKLNALPIKCDLTDSDAVKTAVSSVVDKFGAIDLLVNNAGISYTGLLQEMSDNDWASVINTNLTSAFYTSRSVIPYMLRQGDGVIVNVSSMWGVTGASCEVAYSASKAGIIGFTKALAKELAPSHIRVNAVAPGAIATDMLNEYSEADLKSIADETPLGTIGKAESIADAVYFLAGDSAQFITGEVLNVNGGFVI
ncbi:MAG: 3-oxoacyl-ACP reductase FabG [Clostridia bacterium]|nr:3-oxoacyl-ACP reductase FabG [Clostridia bacterium]